MHQFRIVIAAAAITLYLTGFIQGQSIVIPPSHATGKLKETAVFQCQVKFGTFKEMTWEFSDQIIYSFLDDEEEYPLGKTKYSVARKDGDFHLTVHNLTYDDGGAYTCAAFAPTATACLVVLGTPSITIYPPIPEEGDLVMFQCEAHFGGPNKDTLSPGHIPQLTLSVDGLPESPTLDESVNKLIQTYNVTAEASMDGTKFTCEIRTTNPSMSLNISRVVNVFHSVRNIRFSPEDGTIEIGSNIECIADGHPQPLFEWKNEEDPGKTINGKWLNITKGMQGKNVWKCIARNYPNEKQHEDSLIATFEAVDQSGSGSISYVIIGVLLVILLFVFVIVVFKFRRQIKDRLCVQVDRKTSHRSEETALQENEPLTNPEDETSINQAKQVPLKKDENRNKMNNDQDHKPQSKREIVLFSRESKYDHFINKFEKFHRKEDLDREGEKLLDMLTKHKDKIVNSDPDLVLKLVKKANNLMSSTYYSKIIQIVTDVDDYVETKSKCLRALIQQSEHVSKSKDCVQWSTDLTDLLKYLLNKGANPTWLSKEELQDLKSEDRYTAQDIFFAAVPHILLFKNEMFEELKELVNLFMSGISDNLENCRGTALHALVELDWEQLNKQNEDLLEKFLPRYAEIVYKVKDRNIVPLLQKDWCGRTPLHVFFQGIRLRESMVKIVSDIAQCLISRNNLEATDTKGQNVLHYLAEAFPIMTTEPNFDCSDKEGTNSAISKQMSNDGLAMLDLLKKVTTDANTSVQDQNKHTVLHILANKYNKDISEYFHIVLYELVKIFSRTSNIDIQDKQGCTVLHILVDKYPSKVPDHSDATFLEMMKHLISLSECKTRDNQARTVLHKLAKGYSTNMPKHCQEMFLPLVEVLAKSGADNQDHKGNTVWNILAKKLVWQAPESFKYTLFQAMDHLANHSVSSANVIKDYEGNTTFQTIVKMFSKDIPVHSQEVFGNLVKIFLNESNASAQNENGSTALQILIQKYPHDVSENNTKIFLNVVKDIARLSNKDIQDKHGSTVLHKLVEQYDQQTPKHCKQIFEVLVNMLKSESNTNLQDKQGHTALHIIASKIVHYPELGSGVIPIIELLITKQNVNLTDQQSITPYSWILEGKDKSEEKSEPHILFSKLKKIFKDKTANHETASKGQEVIQQQKDTVGLEANEAHI